MKKKIEDLKKRLWSRMRNYTDNKRLLKRYMNDLNLIEKEVGKELANYSPKPRISQNRGGELKQIGVCAETDNGSPEDTQKGVFIERAGKLDAKGIRAVCGTDKEYNDYVNKITKEDTQKGCEYCDGRGYFYKSIQYPCPKCSGTKESKCPSCHSTTKEHESWCCMDTQKGCGKITEYNPKLAHKCGEDDWLCPKCSGKLSVENQASYDGWRCSGDGE